MNMKRKTKRPVYIIKGEALDQETVIRQRPLIEDYVRTDLKKYFRKTNATWEMNTKGNFDFRIEFYA